jgi:ribonuclease T
VTAAGLRWDPASAHSAIYDAERTAALFCSVCNRFRFMYEEASERVPPGEADAREGLAEYPEE